MISLCNLGAYPRGAFFCRKREVLIKKKAAHTIGSFLYFIYYAILLTAIVKREIFLEAVF